jgi:hypothetical protein
MMDAEMGKHIAVIGNAPISRSVNAQLEKFNAIVRFNMPPHDPDVAGERTDLLVTVNSKAFANEYLPRLPSSLHFRSAKLVVLPWHPQIVPNLNPPEKPIRRMLGMQRDWTKKILDTVLKHGKAVRILDAAFGKACFEELGQRLVSRPKPMPSTGFVGVRYVLDRYPDAKVRLYGFTWEGWEGHDWAAEKRWMAQHPRVELA